MNILLRKDETYSTLKKVKMFEYTREIKNG